MKRYILICFALSACVDDVTFMTKEQRIATFTRQCTADYGFKAGTEAFSTCMMTLDARAKDEANAAAQEFGLAMQAYSTSLNANRMSCTSQTFGGTTQTNCY